MMTASISIASGKRRRWQNKLRCQPVSGFVQQGKKVVLFDTDFGMANAHILLGTNPRHSAANFLKGELDDILTEAPQN